MFYLAAKLLVVNCSNSSRRRQKRSSFAKKTSLCNHQEAFQFLETSLLPKRNLVWICDDVEEATNNQPEEKRNDKIKSQFSPICGRKEGGESFSLGTSMFQFEVLCLKISLSRNLRQLTDITLIQNGPWVDLIDLKQT